MTSPAFALALSVASESDLDVAVSRRDPLCQTTTVGHLDELNRQMALLADGDRSAVGPVFQALWPVVQACCRRALGNEADADDAAQQAMETIFKEASRYDRTRPALPWAAAIASWECRTTHRRRQRARTVPIEVAPETASPGMSPEDAVTVAELLSAAETVFGTLSAADRDVIQQTFAEEVHERMSATGPTLRKRRERALRRLRAAWRKAYGG